MEGMGISQQVVSNSILHHSFLLVLCLSLPSLLLQLVLILLFCFTLLQFLSGFQPTTSMGFIFLLLLPIPLRPGGGEQMVLSCQLGLDPNTT